MTASNPEKSQSTHVPLYINGEWREGKLGQLVNVVNPATEEVFATVSLASEADLAAALAAAERGFETWRAYPTAKRADMVRHVGHLLRERIDSISHQMTLEQGKCLAQSKWEVAATAATFEELANCAVHVYGRGVPLAGTGLRREIVYEPVGPIFAASPWNLPALMPGRKVASALAAGCSVVLKPARETPLTALAIGKCCDDAGIPPGVINIVVGPSDLVASYLINSPIIRKISFTGSTDVGKRLAQLGGAQMKKMSLELGGHAPVIVFDDVDIAEVVDATLPARYSNAGQSCMAATRFFVQEKIYKDFVALFSEKAAAVRVGNGLDPHVQMGPLANARRIAAMQTFVKDAVEKGARLTAGGSRLDRKGYYFGPTVLADVPANARIMQEEPFGPVTPIAPFRTGEEALKRANETPYGLASYVFSHDLGRAERLASGIEAGLVGINSMAIADHTVPFGGVKDSGVGREGSFEGLLECMVTKTVTARI